MIAKRIHVDLISPQILRPIPRKPNMPDRLFTVNSPAKVPWCNRQIEVGQVDPLLFRIDRIARNRICSRLFMRLVQPSWLAKGLSGVVSDRRGKIWTFRMSTILIVCPTMKRKSCLRACTLALLSLVGCHFRAGFGPAPSSPPSIEHSLIRDTTESKEGGKKINETDRTTSTFQDGRSTTLETVNVTVTEPDGSTSRKTTQTKTDRSSNGTVSTMSSSSSGN